MVIRVPVGSALVVCLLMTRYPDVQARAQDAGQQPPPLAASQLQPVVPLPVTGAREVTARLTLLRPPPAATSTPGEPAMAPPTAVEVLSVRPLTGPAPIDLKPELSPFHLLLVSVDDAGATITWRLVLDPRRIRAEFAAADGVRTGTELLTEATELQFVIPDDPRIVAVRVYEPRWTGTTYDLQPVGTCDVRAR